MAFADAIVTACDEILEGREETPYLKEEDQGRIYAKEHLDLFGSNYQDASGQTRRMMFVWHVLIDEAYAHAREIKGDIPDC
jgi:hypothetical protein